MARARRFSDALTRWLPRDDDGRVRVDLSGSAALDFEVMDDNVAARGVPRGGDGAVLLNVTALPPSVVSRVPTAATIDSRDARENITQITEGGVVTTYTYWLGSGSIPDDSIKTETTLGKTKTFTYAAGVLTGWTVA